jgi:hypothetical protein
MWHVAMYAWSKELAYAIPRGNSWKCCNMSEASNLTHEICLEQTVLHVVTWLEQMFNFQHLQSPVGSSALHVSGLLHLTVF